MKTLKGYVGRLGSGKGYCMMQEVERLKTTGNSVYLVSFADPIKQILRESFGLTKAGQVRHVDDQVFSKNYVRKEIVNSLQRLIQDCKYPQFTLGGQDIQQAVLQNYLEHEDLFYSYVVDARENVNYDYSFRRLAQLLGTELARHVVDSIWIDVAMTKVKQVFREDLADYAFIDDCRFINEFEAFEAFKSNKLWDAQVIGVTVSDETRAKRRNMTLEELKAQDEHDSERSIETIINMLPPESIIINEG